ncbi:MAG TPA: hypothetical protein VNX21_01465, partial [Candidatus Thermoplasmatota archaeon]|nr:hypothetical protein [Candidatus Thermoplasmatota archaeon]
PHLAGRIVSHAGDALQPLDGAYAALRVRLAETGFRSGEPTVGVTSDGTLFTTAGGVEIARSTDHGKSWALVTPPATDLLVRPKTSLDPWIWVDPATDRVFDSPLYVVCTWAAWSDDKGESWKANPLTGCGTPAHDHQKLTTGAPPAGVQTSGYPSVVYYSYNSFRGEGTVVLTSYDGGLTYGNERVAHKDDACHAGIAGPVAVGPDGTAYSPKPTCDGVAVAVSRDGGASWETPVEVTDVGSADALAHMTDAAVDAAGNAYVTWTGEDGFAYVAASTDKGASWGKPLRVSPPTLNATVYNVIAAGADGRLVVGYLGTPSDTKGWASKDAQSADADTAWHAYLTFIEDAASAAPRMTTVQVTPDDDPVQRGCIWQSGGSNPCRNLGDFIDLVLGKDGRPYLVYPDGCKACKTAAESRRADVVVAIVEEGPSLLGGALAPLLPS